MPTPPMYPSSKFLLYRRVDRDAPAASIQRSHPSGGFLGNVWCIEPGDGTHYELAFRGDVVIAASGSLDEYGAAHGIILFDSGGRDCSNWQPYGRRPTTEYTTNVLKFFATMALGYDAPEPEELASRRPAQAPMQP